MFIFPSLFRASATPSTNLLSDVSVHDAMMKLRHVAMIAVERFIVDMILAMRI
jgi:hypothetical protein